MPALEALPPSPETEGLDSYDGLRSFQYEDRRSSPSMPPPKPTDAELAILRVLWEGGASAVRAVHERLGRGTGYTTVLKLLQIMHGKGLVERDESSRVHVYAATVGRAETERRLVRDLAERAFGGSAARLALRALGDGSASAEELEAIRSLLDRVERERR